MELGDFQRQVGTTSEQASFGMRAVEIGQIGDGQRYQAALVAAVEFTGFARRNGFEAGNGLRLVVIELVGLGLAAGLFGSRQNRAVTGAAAEVAGQRFLGLVQVWCIAVLLQGKQRHDKTGGAEAALRAVAVGHGLLHAVQLALMFETFDADQLLAVQRRNKGQARVQAAVADLLAAVVALGQFADHHRAGTTIAAGAAFLGTGLAQVLAQVLQHCQVGIQGMLTAQLLV
ncbi:hypothetical protein D3C78_1193340 [compost metagenome]